MSLAASAPYVLLVHPTVTNLAVEAIGSTPEQFGSLLREEWAKWGTVIKAAGIKAR